jgi:hypothetical protein
MRLVCDGVRDVSAKRLRDSPKLAEPTTSSAAPRLGMPRDAPV